MNLSFGIIILVIALSLDLCLASFPKPPLTPGAHNITGESNPVPQKGSRSGFDHNYGLWSTGQQGIGSNRVDVMQLLPILLILGLGIMLLPIITSCLTTLFSPLGMGGGSPYFPHGKKKRELLDQGLPSMTDMVINLLANLEKAIEKYGKE